MGPDLLIDDLPGKQQDAQGQQDQRSNGEDDGIPAALGRVGHRLGSLLLMGEIDTVGASLLAKNVNDNAGNLTVRGALTLIASKLAPTSSEARNAKTNAPHRRGAVYRAT
ncbi:hypothetical protein D3C76_1321170 [compost metagenome]